MHNDCILRCVLDHFRYEQKQRAIGRLCIHSVHSFFFATPLCWHQRLYNVTIVIAFHMHFCICLFCLCVSSRLHYISGIWKVYYIRYDNLSVPFSSYVLGAQFSVLLLCLFVLRSTIDCCTYHRPYIYAIVCYCYQLFCCLFVSYFLNRMEKAGGELINPKNE